MRKLVVRINRGQSFQRIVNKTILQSAANGESLDRKTIIEKALVGRKKSASSGSHYRNLGLTLHFVRCHTDKSLFDAFLDESGLRPYYENVDYVVGKSYDVIFKALVDKSIAHLFQPLTNLMDQLNECVYCRVTGLNGPFTTMDLQNVRGHVYYFQLSIEALDETKNKKWAILKSQLDLPKYNGGPRGSNKRKFKDEIRHSTFAALVFQGSKKRSCKEIIRNFPSTDKFIDLFCGSGVVGLSMKAHNPKLKLILNDAARTVYAFHVTVRDNVESLISRIGQPDEDCWNYYRNSLDEDLPLKELAWRFYYVLNYSFAQKGNFYSPSFTCKDSLKIKRLRKAAELLRDVTIMNLDFREVIEQNGIVYADAPYLDTNSPEFYKKFTIDDHCDLCDILRRRKETWFFSHEDHPVIRGIYGGFNFQTINFNRSMGGKSREICELLISNKE